MSDDHLHPAAPPGRPERPLGLPLWAIVALAGLSVPRIFVHDLGIEVGALGNALLAIGPAAVWILVVLLAKVPSPVVTLVAVGAVYGVALGVVHNLLWGSVFGAGASDLSALTPDVDLAEYPLRIATFVSSLFTGLMVGLIAGMVATGIRWLGTARRRRGGRL